MSGAAGYMVIGATVMWVIHAIKIVSYNMFAKNMAYNTRIQYFTKSLEKDAAYYDEHPPTEMASKIAREMNSVENAFGDKFSMIWQGVFSTMFGLGFAFTFGWFLTLLLFAAFPIIGGAFFGYMKSIQGGAQLEMKAYA